MIFAASLIAKCWGVTLIWKFRVTQTRFPLTIRFLDRWLLHHMLSNCRVPLSAPLLVLGGNLFPLFSHLWKFIFMNYNSSFKNRTFFFKFNNRFLQYRVLMMVRLIHLIIVIYHHLIIILIAIFFSTFLLVMDHFLENKIDIKLFVKSCLRLHFLFINYFSASTVFILFISLVIKNLMN